MLPAPALPGTTENLPARPALAPNQGKAYTLTLSSYVEAVKQIEILFAMGIGVVAFGEGKKVRESALGAVVMLLGMVLLALAT